MTLPVGSHDFVFLLFPPHTYFGRSSNGIGIDIDTSVDIDTNVMRLIIEFQVLSCVHCITHLTMHPTQLKKKKMAISDILCLGSIPNLSVSHPIPWRGVTTQVKLLTRVME